MNEVSKAQAISRSSLGTELDEQESHALAERMGMIRLDDGELLITEGEERRTLFLLIEGRVDVIKLVGNAEVTVYQMREGECAGTRAFVDGSPRKAALRAVGKSTVLTLQPDDFESLLESHARIVYKVMRAIFRITHGNLMRVNLESAELKNYVTKSHGRY
ncbi:MAG: cyclic nucleotide-binding domain-containing protein [Gammaproteobacteria bacterium]|jgi:CRP-like cAMP-binding protein